MQLVNETFQKFLSLLNSHDVEYLVIGGYAVNFYGYSRYTADLDIWVNRTQKNFTKLIDALEQFGYKTDALVAKDISKPLIFSLGEQPFCIEILSGVVGLQFEEVYPRRNFLISEGIEIPFIHLNDLKVNKLLSGRHKDLDDLENL